MAEEDSIKALLAAQQPSAAKVGLGALQALIPGVQALFSRSRRRSHEKRAEQIDRMNREKKYGFGVANINRAEEGLLRDQERAPSAISAKMAGIGASGGSQEQQAIRDNDYRFKTRMNQLQQQRAELKWGKEYGEEVRSLQESMGELAEKEAKINALIQTTLEIGKAVV